MSSSCRADSLKEQRSSSSRAEIFDLKLELGPSTEHPSINKSGPYKEATLNYTRQTMTNSSLTRLLNKLKYFKIQAQLIYEPKKIEPLTNRISIYSRIGSFAALHTK